MNYNNFIVYDFETTGVDPRTAQIVQIGAVAVDSRKLEIIPNSEFNILVKPLWGEECAKANLQELTEGAIKVHKKDKDLLDAKGVSIDTAIKNMKSYADQYNPKKTKWTSPIRAGYNIGKYDDVILGRDLERTGTENFFHPINSVDLIQLMFLFFENDKNVSSLSADSLFRKHMGWKDKGQSHDALSDVIMTAEVMIRSLRLIRKTVSKVKFENCFTETE